MDLLHENGLIFGNSVCYTSKNMDAVTSDEFFDLLIEHGSRFAWYFHLMPVGMKASPELMPTKEQREYIYHRLREVRGLESRFLHLISRTTVNTLEDVSPEDVTTVILTRRVM